MWEALNHFEHNGVCFLVCLSKFRKIYKFCTEELIFYNFILIQIKILLKEKTGFW